VERCEMDSSDSGYGLVAGSVKGEEFLDYLSDY
jgi:hypothetical protein